MRETISLDAYLASRLTILNSAHGARGYDQGVRTFNCPLCHETKGRGWMNVERWTAGCWNAGCEAEPRMLGGAIAWIARHEGFTARGATWAYLKDAFPSTGVNVAGTARGAEEDDFCRLPVEYRRLSALGPGFPVIAQPMLRFVATQWGLTASQAAAWGLGYCFSGRYASRVIIPIIMNGVVVAFQARTWRGDEPKYLTSHAGPHADPLSECARPARRIMFNLDGTLEGDEILLVEGPGDAMHWHRGSRERSPHAVAILGMALTPEKLSMLAEINPGRVIVALDNEPEAQKRAMTHIQDLVTWGLRPAVGLWRGAKDAAAGATLEMHEVGDDVERVKMILGRH